MRIIVMLMMATFLAGVAGFYNFIPDDLASFEVKGNSAEKLLENITSATRINGAYQVNEARESIDIFVRSPAGRTIYQRLNVSYGSFVVNASEPGLYEMEFVNRRKKGILVTLALDVERGDMDEVSSTDIDPLEGEMEVIYRSLKDLYYDNKFQQLKYDTQTSQVKEANKRIYLFTVIETALILGVTIWQMWYIKRLHRKMPSELLI